MAELYKEQQGKPCEHKGCFKPATYYEPRYSYLACEIHAKTPASYFIRKQEYYL